MAAKDRIGDTFTCHELTEGSKEEGLKCWHNRKEVNSKMSFINQNCTKQPFINPSINRNVRANHHP